MRADDAKRLATKMNAEKIATQYAEILGHIHRRASDGHLQFVYGGYMYDQNKEALTLMGYVLANDKGTDSILVSWREASLRDGEEAPLIIPS